MQNKPNFLDTQMNVTSLITVVYENKLNCKLCENKPNSNPIKANTKPKQTQYKPNQTQFRTQRLSELPYEEFLTHSLTLPGFDGTLSPT